MQFNVNFPQLIRDLTPPRLRNLFHLSWLETNLKPSADIHQDFTNYVASSRKRLKYNSQTIVLESALNDVFDPALRRIFILNNPGVPPWLYKFSRSEPEPNVFAYSMAENQPPLFAYSTYEHLISIGFVVNVPFELEPEEIAIRTLIERLKYPTITYIIKYF